MRHGAAGWSVELCGAQLPLSSPRNTRRRPASRLTLRGQGTGGFDPYLVRMSSPSSAVYDRVAERRRAVVLARHFSKGRGTLDLPKSPSASVDRKRRSRPTSNAHRRKGAGGQVKARDVGMCRGGAYTQPRNGKGDAYRHWKRYRPGAIARRWTEQVVLDAMRDWQTLYGRLPSSYDWSRTHARRRGGQRFGGWRAGSGRHPPSSPRCSGLGESCVKRPRRLRRTDSVIALDSSLTDV